MAENRRQVKWGTLAAIAVAGALFAGAVLVMTSLQPRVEQSREYNNSFDGVTVVVVDVDSADAVIGASTDGRSTVHTLVHWNTNREPPYRSEMVGTTLNVRMRGCGLRFLGAFCEARVAVTVPATVELRVSTDAGHVRVDGIRGSVQLSADSGDLDLSGLAGSVSARLDSGRLSGRNLTSTTVDAQLDSGDIDLQFATAPTSVITRTDSGQVTIALPEGSGPYGVRTKTESGQTQVDVPTGGGTEHRIEASTDSGDITIRYQRV